VCARGTLDRGEQVRDFSLFFEWLQKKRKKKKKKKISLKDFVPRIGPSTERKHTAPRDIQSARATPPRAQQAIPRERKVHRERERQHRERKHDPPRA
jgi:hypothetical protein